MARGRGTTTHGPAAVLVALLALALIAAVSAQQVHEVGAAVSAQSQQQAQPSHSKGGKKVGFNIQPKEGPASGGTLVTLHMAGNTT